MANTLESSVDLKTIAVEGWEGVLHQVKCGGVGVAHTEHGGSETIRYGTLLGRPSHGRIPRWLGDGCCGMMGERSAQRGAQWPR